jgi:arabinofuranosyltransferase
VVVERPGTFIPGDGPLDSYLRPLPFPSVRPRAGLDSDVVAWAGGIGRTGFAAGANVHLADLHGLADPLAARIELRDKRGSKPGHEKVMPREWVIARFAEPADLARQRAYLTSKVLAARSALHCGDLERILAAVDEPLTPGRFLRNIGVAVSTGGFRIPRSPLRAQRELCG